MMRTGDSALQTIDDPSETRCTSISVRPGCALLGFDKTTENLCAASDNLEQFFGDAAKNLMGQPLSQLVGTAEASAFRMRHSGKADLEFHRGRMLSPKMRPVRWFHTETTIFVEVFSEDRRRTIAPEQSFKVDEIIREAVETSREIQSVGGDEIHSLVGIVANRFRNALDLDRVTVYRFDLEESGQVIAESQGFNGSDPAKFHDANSADIFRHATELFGRNRSSPVSDSFVAPIAVLFDENPSFLDQLDVSACTVLAEAPVHASYLSRLGVRVAHSCPIIVQGALWGFLTAQKFRRGDGPDPLARGTCCALSEALASRIFRIEERTDTVTISAVRNELRHIRERILEAPAGQTLRDTLLAHQSQLMSILRCDGLVLRLKCETISLGYVPDHDGIADIADRVTRLLRARETDAFATDCTAAQWSDLSARTLENAAGLIACVSPVDGAQIIGFRREQDASLTWGSPNPGTPSQKPWTSPQEAGEELQRKAIGLQGRSIAWDHRLVSSIRELCIGLSELEWFFEWRRADFDLATARAEAEHIALHDALTGLPNRRHFANVLASLTPGVARFTGLVHLDLDGFKEINDSLGHSSGDHALSEIARRLRGRLGPEDFGARIGGDEFVALTAHRDSAQSVVEFAESLARDLARPVIIKGTECAIETFVGVAINDDPEGSGETLLHRSETALHESRRLGPGRIAVFTTELEARQRRAKRLGEEILAGIRAGQFSPWYQPQFDAVTGALVGVEALLRWDHPTRGTLTPDRFLPLAEEGDHLATLDAISMERAVADYWHWAALDIRVPKVSINVSAHRLSDPDLIASIKRVDMPRETFSFELLESIYLDEIDPAIELNLDAMRDLGVSFEVDDFGTGRTSIVSLVKLRPDRLKIDRQLVVPVLQSESARQLIRSIVEIGQSLGIGVTAEGVETSEHIDVLRDLGCSVLQGFALARPMASRDLVAFVRNMASAA